MLQKYSIRKKPVDFAAHFIKRGVQKKKTMLKIASLSIIMGVVLSTQIVGAQGPNANPPFGQVTPNFDSTIIDSRASEDDPHSVQAAFTEIRGDDNVLNPTILLNTVANALNSVQILIGGEANTFRLLQQINNVQAALISINASGALSVNATRLGAIIDGIGDLRFTNSFSLTAPNIIIRNNGIIDAPRANLDSANVRGTLDANTVNATTVTASYINSSQDSGAVYFDSSWVIVDPLNQNRGGIGFAGNNGFITSKNGTSQNFRKNIQNSGTVTMGTCSNDPVIGDDRPSSITNKEYGSAFACGYTLAGNTTGVTVTRAEVDTDGRSCTFDWQSTNNTGAFFINGSTLCYRGGFVGL